MRAFTGRYKETGLKKYKDNSEGNFHFKYIDTSNIEEANFLSNLVMTGTTLTIETEDNLDWDIKDAVIIEDTRYQVKQIFRRRVSSIKNSLRKPYYVYQLLLGA